MSALWLAPLRGVTIRAFRTAFAGPIAEAGFAGAYAPFIPANPGLRITAKTFADLRPVPGDALPVLVPQAISRHPDALRVLLKGFKDAGFAQADLNAGCPFPMIRRRGRGSGLLATPDVLERLIEAGCDEMGEGRFSVKVRLGIASPCELAALLPIFDRYPLSRLVVHARTAKQMYEGAPDWAAFAAIAAASKNPICANGDMPFPAPVDFPPGFAGDRMVGRAFVRALGARDDAGALLARYVAISRAELPGDRPVLGRVKELLSYWLETPHWRRLWPLVKICRSLDELHAVLR